MKVELLTHTPEPEKTIAVAGRLCYSRVGVDELKEKLDDAAVERMINKLSSMGHYSTFEHVSFTYPESENEVIHDVNLKIKSGSMETQKLILKDTQQERMAKIQI